MSYLTGYDFTIITKVTVPPSHTAEVYIRYPTKVLQRRLWGLRFRRNCAVRFPRLTAGASSGQVRVS